LTMDAAARDFIRRRAFAPTPGADSPARCRLFSRYGAVRTNRGASDPGCRPGFRRPGAPRRKAQAQTRFKTHRCRVRRKRQRLRSTAPIESAPAGSYSPPRGSYAGALPIES
jgi:hypothetical protein